MLFLLVLLLLHQLLVPDGLKLPSQLTHAGPIARVWLQASLKQASPLWLTPLWNVQVQVATHETHQDLLGRILLYHRQTS